LPPCWVGADHADPRELAHRPRTGREAGHTDCASTRRRHPEGCLRASGPGGGSRTPLSGTSWREPVPRPLDHHVFAPITSQRLRDCPSVEPDAVHFQLKFPGNSFVLPMPRTPVGLWAMAAELRHPASVIICATLSQLTASWRRRRTAAARKTVRSGAVTEPEQAPCVGWPTDRSRTARTHRIEGSVTGRRPGRGGSTAG
jgi:hypothetical protein